MTATSALALKRPARYAPRGPRIGVNLRTSFVLADDRVVPVTIENLSANGFMAKCRRVLPENSWLGVELPGCGVVRARVRWTEGREVGCQFRRPIPLDNFGPAPAQAEGVFR
jgi:hypothetical protein